ncbi:MAG: hypothetical protein ACKVRN_14235 [Pyrinomonadaceae bacterium]
MVITKTDFRELEDKYGGFASWAIWDLSDPTNSEIIRNNIESLNPSVVMVGLNISAPLQHPWSNFRIGRNDRKLIHAFNEGRFRGAYMTDLFKGEIEVNSANIQKRIRNGELDILRHTRDFVTEMNDIGADQGSLFILFGGLVAELFKKYLAGHYPYFVACQHYAVYGSKETWASETLERLTKYDESRSQHEPR